MTPRGDYRRNHGISGGSIAVRCVIDRGRFRVGEFGERPASNRAPLHLVPEARLFWALRSEVGERDWEWRRPSYEDREKLIRKMGVLRLGAITSEKTRVKPQQTSWLSSEEIVNRRGPIVLSRSSMIRIYPRTFRTVPGNLTIEQASGNLMAILRSKSNRYSHQRETMLNVSLGFI